MPTCDGLPDSIFILEGLGETIWGNRDRKYAGCWGPWGGERGGKEDAWRGGHGGWALAPCLALITPHQERHTKCLWAGATALLCSGDTIPSKAVHTARTVFLNLLSKSGFQFREKSV